MAANRKSASASRSSAAKKAVKRKPAKKQLAKKLHAKHGPRKRGKGPHVPKQIVAIDVRVVYQLPNGRLKEMAVDTNKVFGITWDLGVHGSTIPKAFRKPGPPPPAKGPRRQLGKCEATEQMQMMVLAAQSGGGACCWWNGKRWICPDEFE